MSPPASVVTRADCTPKCRSAQHTSELTSALCTRAEELSALVWCARSCHNPGRSKDLSGRALTHVAAGRGLVSVLEWVTGCREAGQLNGKDTESGYSPLHRAMFHGQMRTVVWLIEAGANLALLDHDGLTCLDHAVLDRPLHLSYEVTAPLDAYAWGTNSNFNLGLGNNTNRSQPDIVEGFRKDNINISKVCLQKFHSAFLSRSGQVMTCGHGRGGRLGHGSETMQLVPKVVQLPSPCIGLALGVDHSVFLCEGGSVLTCGLNTHHQLGHFPPPPLLLAPAPVTARSSAPKFPAAVGVAAARFHTLFWTADAVYTWGLNGGQLGHIKGERSILQPKLVSSLTGRENKITEVAVSDGASVMLTARGDVMALCEYQSKKLGQRQHNVVKIAVTGGHLDPGSGQSPGEKEDIDFKLVAGGGSVLRVMLLSVTGRVSIWEDDRENSFIPCVFNVSKEIIVKDIVLHKSGLVIVTAGGEAWSGTHQPSTAKPSSKIPVKDVLKIKRLPNIHRGVSVSCDAKGRNFCVLQVCPNEALTEIPEISCSSMKQNMTTMLRDVSEHDDLHDVVCLVAGKRFPAHAFILASGSESFAKQLKYMNEEVDEETEPEPVILEVEDVLPQIFEQILKYLYTKTCDLLLEGPCNLKIEEPKTSQKKKNNNSIHVNGNPKEVSAFSVYNDGKRKKKTSKSKTEREALSKEKTNNPLIHLQEAAKQLGMFGLAKTVDCLKFSEGNISWKIDLPRPKLDFCSKNSPELQDVTIICDNEEELLAHKCVLVSRSEYFFSMLSSGWSESCCELTLPLEVNLVQTVLDYLYTDDCVKVNKSEDVEFVCNILVVADQFLLSRLKQICECQLTRLLTLKNVAELFQFSVYYMADQLQRSAMQFICLNLPALLEARALKSLDETSWKKLDNFYRNSNPVFRNRRLVPILDLPTAEVIENEFEREPTTLEELKAAEEMAKLSLKPRRRRISSGEKVKLDLGRNRLNSGGSYSEESEHGNESDDDDKMSFKDFEMQEKSGVEGEDKIIQPREPWSKESTPEIDEGQGDKSFFTELLNKKPIQTETLQSTKKSGRISQKERKRLSREATEAASPSEDIIPSKSSGWSGWASIQSPAQRTSSSSLIEIMKVESKTPVQQQEKSRTQQKSEKKTSWKKIDLSSSFEATSTSPSPVKSNPWKLPAEVSPEKEKMPELGKKNQEDTFQQIMKEDVKKEENLIKIQSKPLHITQIEEKAIEELKKFYNVSSCKDEIITVSRLQTVSLATPVWKKANK